MLRQRRRGFVEDHHLRLKRQRAGNRHHVTLGDAQGFQRCARVDLHLKAGENSLRPAVHFRPVELFQEAFVKVLTNKDIFGDREFIKQDGFLVYGGDTHFMRRLRRWKVNGDRLVENFALVGLVYAGHHFDQRRLARAVFADKRRHFAGPQRKLHVLKSTYAGEHLGDARKL